MRHVFQSDSGKLSIRATVSLLSMAGAMAFAAPAYAQTASSEPGAAGEQAEPAGQRQNEIVVTAERRRVDIQKTTIAATVLDSEMLKKKGIDDVDALQFSTPG